jgi:hypothetical protein
MKANNYEQTIKQVPNEWGITIPDTIDELSKGYYHVLMVTRQHIPEQETYRTISKVTQFSSEMWNNKKYGIKDQLPTLGYKHCFILHDPTKKEEVKEKVEAPKEEVKEEPVVVKKPAGRPKKNS